VPKQTVKPTNAELPGLNNPADVPWMRQRGESWQAYRAFSVYRDIGPSRDHTKTRDKVGCNISLIRKWSARWDWVERVGSFDANESYERMVRMREGRIRMWEHDARLARELMDKVWERLKSMSPHEMSVSQLLQAIKIGHEIQKSALAGGAADVSTQGQGVDEELQALEKLMDTDPEIADAIAIIARAQRQQSS
jgi:hypothetical protein